MIMSTKRGSVVTSDKTASDARVTADSDDVFFMTNLSPRMTGLPMSVWVSPRGNARHDVRIKVNMTHGNRMNFDDTAVVAVRPSPRVIAGQLSSQDRQAVVAWIRLNHEAIVAYWDAQLDTGQFFEQLKILPRS
jgi:hypothetical protein